MSESKLYSVATEHLPTRKFMKQAKLIQKMDGFTGVHISPRGMIWLFDSLNNAKIARNILLSKRYGVGVNIGRFNYDGESISFDGPGEE